nr:VWA domain-containing protein [Candidatus Acidoferrales bacterium]
MRHYPILAKLGIASLAILSVIIAIPEISQSQTANPSSTQTERQDTQNPPALRVLTRLVQISVIADNGNGKPVTGLTKDDFNVFDQGQEQKIEYFAEQSIQSLSATAAATAPPPDIFSNRFEQKAGAPTSATVILMDMRNTRSQDMVYARKQVDKFLSQIQPQDRVALYSLTNKLTILHDFTDNAASLMTALKGVTNADDFRIGASEPGAADTGDANLNASVNAANGRVAEFYMNDRVERTALAIKVIADHLKGLPGRKNLIWVSGAFPIQILTAEGPTPQAAEQKGSGAGSGPATGLITGVTSYTDQIEDAARSLNTADVAVYPVDARGLIGNPSGVNKPGPRGGLATMRANMGSSFPARDNFDTMNTFAERTGGRAFYNTNDIQGAVRKAIDDSSVTYVLGYYPANTNWDGKFRQLKVRTDKPGVHLRYRLGYYALADAPVTAAQKAELLTDAEWSPLESTDLGLEIKADPIDAPGSREIQLQVRIASNQLHFEQTDGHWRDSLEVVWIEIAASGKQIGSTTKHIAMDVPQDSFDLFTSQGTSFNQRFKVSPEAVELRAVVRDGGSQAIGSVIIPLDRVFAKTNIAAPKN